MGRPARSAETYYQRIAEKMVREGKTIKQAATELVMPFTNEELLALESRKGFQRVLWTERNKFYQEIATDPERGKISLLGQMILNVQKLQAEGEWKEALEGLLKIAKVEGYVGADQQVNIFGNVTPKELEEAKKAIGERLKSVKGNQLVGDTAFTQEPGKA